MTMYRDCVDGASPHWASSDASAVLSDSGVASFEAGADSRRESRQHFECMQQAGWEKN